MSTADPGPDRVVVWRLGEALLAAALDDVVEVAPVAADGRARTRNGALELVVPRGLPASSSPARAVVLRARAASVAVAADGVEGVRECAPGELEPAPPWLGRLTTPAFRALVRLDDERLAALLDPGALAEP